MKGMVQKWERFLWLGVVLIAVAFGVMNGNQASKSGTAGESGGRRARLDRDGRSGGMAGGGSDGEHNGRLLSEKEMRELAMHALSNPMATERFQRVMEMLDETTADNWRFFWQEYIRQTVTEGRLHEAEWELFMNRVGEVAGPGAMEFFSSNGQNEYTFNRREVLRGWASVDPQGAFAWLKNQPEEDRKPEFWQSVLTGATATDSTLALEWLKEVPAKYSSGLVRQTVDGLIQAEGISSTIKSLEDMVARLPENSEPPDYLRKFYQELRSRTERMEWLRKSYPEVEGQTPSLAGLRERFDTDPTPTVDP